MDIGVLVRMKQPLSTPTREAARALLGRDLATLCASATALRRKRFGNTISLCAIINAKSGNCGMDCSFCSQSGRHGAAGSGQNAASDGR